MDGATTKNWIIFGGLTGLFLWAVGINDRKAPASKKTRSRSSRKAPASKIAGNCGLHDIDEYSCLLSDYGRRRDMEIARELRAWIAYQINWNLFTGCKTARDVASVINDLNEWDYEFSRKAAIDEALSQLDIKKQLGLKKKAKGMK